MGNTISFTNPQPPKDSAPTGQRTSGKAILIAVLGASVVLTGIGIGAASGNSSTTSTVTATAAATTTSAAPAPAAAAPTSAPASATTATEVPPPVTGTGGPATADPAETMWMVSKIVDGDTVDVTKAGTTNRIRVIGIDTPEVGQCGYLEATANMKTLLAGKHVNVVPGARDDLDRYGRYLRYLDVDGTDAGLRQIQAGLAVARYDSRDGYGAHPRETSYVAADAASPKAACSTVATPQPVPSKPANPAPAPVPPAAAWPLAGDQHPCPQAKPIKGNQSSMIAHSPGQQSYLVTNPEACFANLTDAAADGYRPAKR